MNLIEKSIKPNLALIFNPCDIKVFIQPLYKETKSWKTKKYELVKEDSIVVEGFTLFRIRALKDFFVVKAGELGGYIEHEGCLSHEGYAWVYDDAKVYNASKVTEGGSVRNNAIIHNGSKVFGFASVEGDAVVADFSIVKEEVTISGNAVIENSTVIGNAKVRENAHVHSKSIVKGFSDIGGNANINDAVIDGTSVVTGSSYVGRGVYLKSVTLINDASISSTNFLSDLRIGFNVKEGNTVATYEDPNFSIRNIAASRVSNQFTTWNASGTAEEIIAAQYSDEEKDKMSKLLQAHMDIYNIQ